MMLKTMAAAGLALTLAGCSVSGRNTVMSMMGAGELRAAPHPTDPALFVVHLSAHDWTPDLEQSETQERIVATLLGSQCGETSIVERRVSQFGRTAFGTNRRLYTLTVRCPNGSTIPAQQ
jgi:hypothetical protein